MRRNFETKRFYHLFNRGVEKRKIFLSNDDYVRFIHDLYEFNDSKPAQEFSRKIKHVRPRGSHIIYKMPKKRDCLVNINAFALMPNHHHLLTSQIYEKGISSFMMKLHGGYTKAFNLKYERNGYLFQGPFKDVVVKSDVQFAYLICYIHANPLDLWKASWKEKKLNNYEIKEALDFLEKYRWSSHLDYLGINNFPSVINKQFLLDFFGGAEGYRRFFIDWLKKYKSKFEYVRESVLE